MQASNPIVSLSSGLSRISPPLSRIDALSSISSEWSNEINTASIRPTSDEPLKSSMLTVRECTPFESSRLASRFMLYGASDISRPRRVGRVPSECRQIDQSASSQRPSRVTPERHLRPKRDELGGRRLRVYRLQWNLATRGDSGEAGDSSSTAKSRLGDQRLLRSSSTANPSNGYGLASRLYWHLSTIPSN